jgi:hypothetical protein
VINGARKKTDRLVEYQHSHVISTMNFYNLGGRDLRYPDNWLLTPMTATNPRLSEVTQKTPLCLFAFSV